MGMITKADYVEIKRAYATWKKTHAGVRIIPAWYREASFDVDLTEHEMRWLKSPLVFPKQWVLPDKKFKLGLLSWYIINPMFMYFLKHNSKLIDKFKGEFLVGNIYGIADASALHTTLERDIWTSGYNKGVSQVYVEKRHLVMRCSASDLPD